MVYDQLVKPKQFQFPVKYNGFVYSENDLSPRLLDFFESEHIKDEVKFPFFDFLCNQDNELKAKLNDYFDQPDQDVDFTPLFSELGAEIISGTRVAFSNNVFFCQWPCSPKW